MLELWTASIKDISRANPYRYDITVKTGDKTFSPSWEMLKAIKGGEMSKEEYKKQYIELMKKSLRENPEKWKDLISKDKVILVCYCPPRVFCHRILLAKMLVKSGVANYMGEIEN